jgi:uncharacterized protein YycO
MYNSESPSYEPEESVEQISESQEFCEQMTEQRASLVHEIFEDNESIPWETAITDAAQEWEIPPKIVTTAVNEILSLGIPELSKPEAVITFLGKIISNTTDPDTFNNLSKYTSFTLKDMQDQGYNFPAVEEIIENHMILAMETYLPDPINNFPEETSTTNQVLYNIVSMVGDIEMESGPNKLNDDDIEKAKKTLQKGDVVLVGALRDLTTVAIGGNFTHAMIYIGNDQFIEAKARGVRIIDAQQVYEDYDTMVITRPYQNELPIINAMLEYALAQVGKPYDFEFNEGDDAFYCSELVAAAYEAAGINMPTARVRPNQTILATLFTDKTIHPEMLLGGNFETVFSSHNIEVSNNRTQLIDDEPTNT